MTFSSFSCFDCRYWRQETVVATPWGPQKRSQICSLRAQADLEQLGPDHAQSCHFYTPTPAKQSMEKTIE